MSQIASETLSKFNRYGVQISPKRFNGILYYVGASDGPNNTTDTQGAFCANMPAASLKMYIYAHVAMMTSAMQNIISTLRNVGVEEDLIKQVMAESVLPNIVDASRMDRSMVDFSTLIDSAVKK